MRNPATSHLARLLAGACLLLSIGPWHRPAATEFGAYWTGSTTRPHPEIPWARGSLTHTTNAQRRAVIAWPGARFTDPVPPHRHRQARFPTRPRDIFNTVATNADFHSPGLGAVEIGNEPDLYFSADTPDRVVAAQKAAYWAIRRHFPDLAVLMPSMAALPGPYFEQWRLNRGGAFTDALNIHFYGWPHDLMPSLATHRRFIARAGRPDLPIWVTEYGVADMPTNPGPVHLARQRAAFERMTLEGIIGGADQMWAFALTPFVLGAGDFGLTGPDGTPRPALAAWLRIIERARQYRPIHRLHHIPSDETIGWILESPDRTHWWTVLFSPWRRSDFLLPEIPGVHSAPAAETSLQKVRLRFPRNGRPLSLGLDGEHPPPKGRRWSFTLSAATNLHILTPPNPFHIADVRRRPVPRRPNRPPIPTPIGRRASPVVAALDAGSLPVLDTRLGYSYEPDSPLRLTASLHEFSGHARSGRWRLTLPPGWSGRTSGRIELAADSDLVMSLDVIPDRSSNPVPRVVALDWFGEDGSRDTARMELRPRGGVSVDWQPLDGEWSSTEPGQEWERAGEELQLVAGAPTASAHLLLPLPAHLTPDTLLRVEVVPDRPDVVRRLELITPRRTVFRHGDDVGIGAGPGVTEARVGDFTPAFWSRTGSPTPEDAAFVRITLHGFPVGSRVAVRVFIGR